MKIRWITPLLGTAAATDVEGLADVRVIDVRDLVDKAGNGSEAIRAKIQEGMESLKRGEKTVVCCDYGMSRSNAVATGILATVQGLSFQAALRRVQEATGETQIKLEPLNAVRAALGSAADRQHETNQRTVLITGGSGFLGRALIASIGGDFTVVSPSHSDVDVGSGSTRLDILASEADAGCIVHLANPRVFTSNTALGQTLTMLRNVIDVCVARGIRLIYPSGWEIYSGYAGTIRADESTTPLPRGPYGEAKYLAEILIEHARNTLGLECGLIRSGPVYGEGGDKPRFLYNFIEKATHAATITTHRYRNGPPALDLLHVDDFVSAVAAMLRTGSSASFNIGTGKLTSTKEVAEILKNSLGSRSKLEEVPIDADVASVAMNWDRAAAALDWQPKISLAVGLERVLAGIKRHEERS
jgi:nucleoside-diphosphate-sugar epimerase